MVVLFTLLGARKRRDRPDDRALLGATSELHLAESFDLISDREAGCQPFSNFNCD